MNPQRDLQDPLLHVKLIHGRNHHSSVQVLPPKIHLEPPTSKQAGKSEKIYVDSRGQTSFHQMQDDLNLVLILRDKLGGRHRFIRHVGDCNFPVQMFLAESQFQSLAQDQVSWEDVQFKVIQFWTSEVPFDVVFTFSRPSCRKLLVRVPRTREEVAELVLENRAFLLSFKLQLELDRDYWGVDKRGFILYGEHSFDKSIYHVKCLKSKLSVRKIFSYLPDSDAQVSLADRSKVREDLWVVLLYMKPEFKEMISQEEEKIFQRSQGSAKIYRRMLSSYIQVVKEWLNPILVLPPTCNVDTFSRNAKPFCVVDLKVTCLTIDSNSRVSSSKVVSYKVLPRSRLHDASQGALLPITSSALSKEPSLSKNVAPSPEHCNRHHAEKHKRIETTLKLVEAKQNLTPTSDSKQVACPFCPLTFSHLSDPFFIHIGLFHLPPTNGVKTCSMVNCSYRISSRVDYLRHQHKHIKDPILMQSIKRLSHFLLQSSLGIEVESYERLKTNSCPFCRIVIQDTSILEEHILLIHLLSDILFQIAPKMPGQNEIICPRIDCQKTFENILKLVMHLGSDHQLTFEFLRFFSSNLKTEVCPFKHCDLTFKRSAKMEIYQHLHCHIGFSATNEVRKIRQILKEEDEIFSKKIRSEVIDAKLCWLKSQPITRFKNYSKWRPWDESIIDDYCQMNLCLVCVNSSHQAVYFHNVYALLLHLIDNHFKTDLIKESDRICKEQKGQSSNHLSLKCDECFKEIQSSQFIMHRYLWHRKVFDRIPLNWSYQFKNPFLSQDATMPRQLKGSRKARKPGSETRSFRTTKKSIEQDESLVQDVISAFQKFCSKQDLTPACVSFEHLKTFIEEHLQTEKTSTSVLEKFVGKLSTELNVPVEDKQVKELLSLQDQNSEANSQSPMVLPIHVEGEDSSLSTLKKSLDLELPEEKSICQNFLLMCQKCNVDFKSVQDILNHLVKDGIKSHQGHSVLCKCCQFQFVVRPTMALNKHLFLHSCSRTHLFHQWCDWHKEDFDTKIRSNLDADFQRICSNSRDAYCELCFDDQARTLLPDHLKGQCHVSSVKILNSFVTYCKDRAICPITPSVQDMSLFLKLVHHNLTPIRFNFQRVLATVIKLQYETNKSSDPIFQDHIQNILSTNPEKGKPIRFLCYVCPQESYNAGNMLDHCKSALHELNIHQRQQTGIPACIRCFPCQNDFEDDLHLRLHVFSPHHLGQAVPTDQVPKVNSTTPEKPLFCYLCRVDVKDKSHFDTSEHMVNEEYILSYLEWCEVSHMNPVSSTPADITTYFGKVIRGNDKSLKCIKSLEMIDCIHEEVCNSRVIQQLELVDYAKRVDEVKSTQTNDESLQSNSEKGNPLEKECSPKLQSVSVQNPKPKSKLGTPRETRSVEKPATSKRVQKDSQEDSQQDGSVTICKSPAKKTKNINTCQSENNRERRILQKPTFKRSLENPETSKRVQKDSQEDSQQDGSITICKSPAKKSKNIITCQSENNRERRKSPLQNPTVKRSLKTCKPTVSQSLPKRTPDSRQDFNEHPYSKAVQSIEEVTTCPKCSKTFDHATHLLLHVVSAHKRTIRDLIVDCFAREKVTCVTCFRECASPMIFALHQDRHHKDTSCSQCKKNFISPSQYYIEDQCGKINISDEVKIKVGICLRIYLKNDEDQTEEGTIVGSRFYQRSQDSNKNPKCAQELTTPTVRAVNDKTQRCPNFETEKVAQNLEGSTKTFQDSQVSPSSSSKRKKVNENPPKPAKKLKRHENQETAHLIQSLATRTIKVDLEDHGTFFCCECQSLEEKTYVGLVFVGSIKRLGVHFAKTGHSHFQNVSSLLTKKLKIELKNL